MYQVRDGQRVVPTCPECGCRLVFNEDNNWYHFWGGIDRDAKGHLCSLYPKKMTQFTILDNGNTLEYSI